MNTELQINELRIGSIVHAEDETLCMTTRAKVIGIFPDGYVEWVSISESNKGYRQKDIVIDLEPIPLTRELLEAIGLEKAGNDFGYTLFRSTEGPNRRLSFRWIEHATISGDKLNVPFARFDGMADAYYLHQLQNIHLALTGLELEVIFPETIPSAGPKGAEAAALAKFPVDIHTVEHPDNHILNTERDRNEDKRALWQDGYQQALIDSAGGSKDLDTIILHVWNAARKKENGVDKYSWVAQWKQEAVAAGIIPASGSAVQKVGTGALTPDEAAKRKSDAEHAGIFWDRAVHHKEAAEAELLPRWYSIDVAPDGYSTIEVEFPNGNRAQGGYYPQPDEFVPSNPECRDRRIPMNAEYIKRWRYHSYKAGWQSPHVCPDDDCEVRALTTDGKVVRGQYRQRGHIFRPGDLADVEGTSMKGRTTFNWNDIYNFIEFWQEITPAKVDNSGWFSPKCIPDYDCTVDVELVGDSGKVTRGEFKRKGSLFVPSGDNESNRHDWGYIRLDNQFQVVRWKLVR